MFIVDENGGIVSDRHDQDKYESFICERLLEDGISLQPIGNRPAERRCGNLLGLDIIYDPRMEHRGGIYIETHFMEVPPLPFLFRSTLFRDNGSWLYGIGNHKRFFIFGKKSLRRIISFMEKHLHLWKNVELLQTATSRGFVIPSDLAEMLSLKMFEFKDGVTCSRVIDPPCESARMAIEAILN